MRALFPLLSLLLAVSAGAAPINSGNIGRAGITQTGRTTTVTPGAPPVNSGGSTIPISPNYGGWTEAGNYGVPPSSTGPTAGINFNGKFIVGGSDGKVSYPASGSFSIPWGTVAPVAAGVVCAFATAGVCGVASGVAAASPYIMNWLERGGMARNPETGNVERPDADPSWPQSDGYMVGLRATPGGVYQTTQQACQAFVESIRTRFNAPDAQITQCTAPTGFNLDGTVVVSFNGASSPIYRDAVSNCPGGWYITPNGCVSGANLPKVVVGRDDLIERLGKVRPDPRVWGETLARGGEIPFPNPTITGPSSIQGRETVRQNADGTRDVSRTTYNFTTNGNQITNTSNVTTTNHFNSSNVQTGTTTTTTTPVEAEPGANEEETAPVDTPLGALPKLYERKYPDGLVGIWNEKKSQLKQSQLFSLPSQLLPTGIAGGSCPSWTIPLDMAGFHDWGMADLTVPCWVYDVVKAIVLIGAAILARALIFGG